MKQKLSMAASSSSLGTDTVQFMLSTPEGKKGKSIYRYIVNSATDTIEGVNRQQT